MWAIIAAVIAVAASAGVYYQQRKMEAQAKKQAQEAKAVQISGHDSNRGLYTVYGKALVGSTTVWKKVSDKQTRMTQAGFTTFSRGTGDLINGTRDLKSNRFLYRAVSLCAGPIQSVENILIDDEGYQSSRFGQGDNRHFAAAVSLGPTAGQNFSAMRTSYSDFNAWGTSFTGKGVAYAIERLYLDNDKPAYQGEPSTKYLVKGRKLYDPRKDSTSSVYDATLGTSSHRFDTPSTWEWSDNPVLALLDYMTNAEYGRGLALSVIDLPSIADSADKCDVLVDIPARLTNTTGSSYDFYDPESGQVITVPINTNIPNYRPEQGSTSQQKRFRINIAIDPSKELLDNIQEILNVFRGNLSYANGKYRVHMADVASPVLTIGDDDIITGLKISNGDRAQRMNRATVKFINANKQHKTDQASWPSLDSNEDDGLYDTFVTEDQGEKLHKTFTIKGCTDFYQAQDTAEFLVRDSRSNLTVAGTFGSRCFGLVPGDIVSLTYDSAGYSGKYFRVMQVAIDLTSMNVNLQLKEYDSSVYTWNDDRGNEPEGLTWQEEVVNAAPTTPVIGTLSSTTRTRADGSTALTLTVPFSNIPEQAQYVDVEWGINGTDQYNSQVVFDTENINQVEVPIERDNATYAVRVRYFIADSAGTLMASTFATDTIAVGNLTGTKLGGIEEGATANNIYQQASEPTGGTYNDGDIWIDTDDGYRMYLRSGGAWVDRADTRIATAISDAAGAQSTADGKVVTFYQDAEPADASSSTGDLWIDTNDNNKLYRYNGTSWDSVRDSGIASAISAAATAQSTADGKIVTFYQDDEPADASSSTGDLWFDTNDNNKLYRYNGTDWVSARDSGIAAAISAAAGAQSTADGKVVTFYQDDEPAAASSSTGDLWIDTNDNNKLYRFNGTSWDSVRDAGIASAISSAATAQSTADGKIVTFYQDDEPADASSSTGDLWFDTNDDNKLYRYNGTDWVSARDAGIADALANAATAQSTADGKIVTFYQDGEPAAASSSEGDLWIDTNDSNKLYRFNGTDWVAARDSGIASAISDAATAQATADGKVTTFYAASSSTPTPEGTGDLWYQTDTQLFFRYNGSAWQEVASYNTGDLADLDTVDTDQIEDNAVDITKIADTLQSTNYSAGSAGWKLTTDGTFEAGNGTFRGALTATSGSIASTVTIGGTAASTVVSGAADGASALQNGDAITDGSVGGTTITSTKLYQGTGTHNNTNTGFYLDSSGNFSLKDKLSFDGTTLSVDGNVTVDEFVKAGSGSTAAVMSGRSADNFAFWAGADFDANGGASGGNAPFRVTRAGKVIMTNFALYSESGQKLFDSTDGLLGLPSTQVAVSTGSLVPSVSDELTSQTDYFQMVLNSTQTITAAFDYPLNYLFSSGTSEADAYGKIATSITVTIQKSTDASTWTTFGSATFTKTDSSSPSSSQYYVLKQTVNLGYEFGGGTLYFASLQPGGAVDDGNVLSGSVSASLGSGTHYLRMQVSYGGSGLAATGYPSLTENRSVTLTTSGAGFTVDSSGNVSDGVSTSATTGWVLSNFVEKTESDNVTINGTLTLGGDLVVNGTTTTINSSTLQVDDKNIVINYGAGDTSASADGAGITIQDAVNSTTDASILWDATNDEFDFSHSVSIAGNLYLPRANEIYLQDGNSLTGNRIGSGLYPSQGFTGTNTYWIEYAAKGGHNFIVNTDGGSTAAENAYDHFTIWQGEVDGRKLFHVTNSNGHVFSRGSFYPSNQTTDYVDSTRIGNWQTAYTYSQVGHVPLAGGTMTGTLKAPTAGIGSPLTGDFPESTATLDVATTTAQTNFSSNALTYGSDRAQLILDSRHSATKDTVLGFAAPMLDFRANNTSNQWSVAQIIGTVDPEGGTGHQGGLVFATSGGGSNDPAGRRNQGAAPTARMLIGAGGNVTILTGDLKFGTSPVTVIDSSRNISNAGTISSTHLVTETNISKDGTGPYDWITIGSGSRAGSLLVNDIAGARYAISAGGYDLTFRKHVDAATDYYADVMRFEANNATSTGANVRVYSDLIVQGSLSLSGYNSSNWDTAYSAVNATNLGDTATGLVAYTSQSDWSKPAGYSSMIRGTATNSAVVGTPKSASYWYYQVIGKRDTGGGTAALLTNYGGDDLYFGHTTTATAPTWRRLWSDIDFSAPLELSGGTMSGNVQFANDSNTGIQNAGGNAGYRPDDIYGNTYAWNTVSGAGYYGDFGSYNFRDQGANTLVSIDSSAVNISRALLLQHTSHNYLYMLSSAGYEQMVRFKNSLTNDWYAGIRTSAGIASTADFHIYSSALGDDAFALTTSGDLVAKRNLNTKTGAVQINGTTVINSSRVLQNVTHPTVFINRQNYSGSGISWYSGTYKAWATYMASATHTNVGPTANITAPSGTLVTSWALRSFIENAGGYGWTFESGTASGNPSVVAEIRASDGASRFGSVTAGGNIETTAGKLIVKSSSNGFGRIEATDANHMIILRGNRDSTSTGVDMTTYYQYGGTLAAGKGHLFYTGGVLASQTLKLGIHNDAINFHQPFYMGGTQVMDTSRNMTSIGTIASGVINAPQIYSSSGNGIRLGNFTGANTDQWPQVVWYRDTANGWDEGLIRGSSSRGVFSRAHFGIHMSATRSFAFHSDGWDTEVEICGDGRTYMKGPVGIGYTPTSTSDNKLTVQGGAKVNSGNIHKSTYNKAVLLQSSGTSSSGSAIGFQQLTAEGWSGIFVDYNPYEGWGLYHDNPSNYFYITAETTTGNLGTSFTVPNRDSGSSQAYAKIRFDQNNGNINAGGAITANGNITAYASDRRLKENFRPIESAVDKVKALNGLYFDWKSELIDPLGFTPDSKQNDVGLIAQEVQTIMPQAVARAPFDTETISTPVNPGDKNAGNIEEHRSISGQDYLTVKYEKLVPLLVAAIKEQAEAIEALEAKLKELENGDH